MDEPVLPLKPFKIFAVVGGNELQVATIRAASPEIARDMTNKLFHVSYRVKEAL